MTPERDRYIGELYHRARALADAEQPQFLDAVCGNDRELRREVESLLAADRHGGAFRSESPSPVGASWAGPPRTLPASTAIGRYRILSLLGRGGMGDVYLAHDPTLGRNVAIKLLRAPLTSSPLALLRFEQEARAASSLNHPNIVTIYEIGKFEDGRFIAMEVVEGRPLSAMTSQRMPVANLLPIARQLAQALAVAHAAGIVHRDIKPENIMVRPDGYVKILDFGVARLLAGHPADGGQDASSVTHPGVLIGTPRYMSPEQVRGEAATRSSDVFALGVVLYELVAGRHPVSGQTTATVQTDQTGAPLRPSHSMPDIPHAVAELILRMLEDDPTRRPDAASVDSELASMGVGTPRYDPGSAARIDLPRPAPPGLHRVHPRNRWLVPAAAGVLVVTVGVIVASSSWFRRSGSTSTATGGDADRLRVTQITANPPTRRVISMALSPDGRYVGYSDQRGAYIRAIDTPDSQLIPDSDRMTVHGWSADSTRLITRTSGSGGPPEQWSISLLSGRERMPVGYPSPDGARVVNLSRGQLTISDHGSSGSGRSADSHPREVRIDLGVQTVLYGVAWSPSGRWLLAAMATLDDAAQNRGRIERVDPLTGDRAVLLHADGIGPIRSAAVSRDGIIFYSQGRTGIWSMSFDEPTGTRRGEPRRITPTWTDVEVSNLGISGDGKRLVYLRFERRNEVHVGRRSKTGVALETLERLPHMDPVSDSPSSWALDGGSIYFSSDRSGDRDIYRQVVGEKQARLLVGGAGHQCCAQPTPDGKWILFRNILGERGKDVQPTLRRLAVGGVLHEEVPGTSGVSYHRCGFQARCIVTSIENGRVVVYDLDWTTGRQTRLAVLPANASREPDISADGRHLAFVASGIPDAGTARTIRILDLVSGASRDIVVKDAIRLRSVAWAADGGGLWTVGLSSSEDTGVWYVPLGGAPVVLSGASGVLPVWVLPSPDDSRLALFSSTNTSNVWMLEGF